MILALGDGSFTNMINEHISRVHHDGIAILLILKVNTRGPFMFKDRLLYILYMDSLNSYLFRNQGTFMYNHPVTCFRRVYILAHQIRISEILPGDRKSYLTNAILPRLSCEGYIHWLY